MEEKQSKTAEKSMGEANISFKTSNGGVSFTDTRNEIG